MNTITAHGNLTPELAGRWDPFVDSHPGASLYHFSRWVAFASEVFGFDAVWLMSESATGATDGVLPMIRQRSRLFGDRWVSLPFFNYGGPLATNAKTAQRLIDRAADHARGSGVGILELRDMESRDGLARRADKATLILDLPPTSEGLAAGLGAKLRSQIRRADRESPEVIHGGRELAADFYRIFAESMRDLGTPVLSRRFFDQMLERLGADCRIVVVRLAGRGAAAALLTKHRDTIEIPWAASLARYRPAAANMRLYWECLKYAIETGHRRFDFGRSTIDSGTYRFKLQWGAQPAALHWHYPLAPAAEHAAPESQLIESAKFLWRRLPVPVANHLGPCFSAGLPW